MGSQAEAIVYGIRHLIIALFGITAAPALAKSKDLNKSLDKVISQHSIGRGQVGLAVIDLQKNELIYGLNENKDLTPASITKIVTAAAVLQKIGAGTKLQTGLYSAAPVKDGVLKGDLLLKGGGDSGFVSESMWFLVNELMRTGIKKVEGDVLVDDTDFDSVRADPSRDPERVDRAYDAPVGAMSFNWNSISIFIRPGEAGKPPQVYLDPIDNGFTVVNRAKTTSSGGNNLEVSRDGNKITVNGSIGVNANEVPVYKNIDDPVEWSGRNLIFFLSQRGITVGGKARPGERTPEMKLLAKADSKPIALAVADMMKFSNNYVAEMLTKNLAAHKAPTETASLEAGMKVVRSTLAEMGIPESRFTLVNPSGLSRRNKMKAADMAKVLAASYRHFPSFAEYLTALPMAGIDGTLKNRMKNSAGQGWVRAKTGLLTGVVGLAGYAGRKDGSVRAFVFIFNGKGEQGDSARRLFDALATELVQ
jgi:D-alanyl-D-alanine carboxypeptidase/D-alanyl-D-alanine-endopeptidase (penicillin-binding protein 4)